MIHAIARRKASSTAPHVPCRGAGPDAADARTAREQAGKVGLSHTPPGALDRRHHLQHPTRLCHFQRMLSYYGGSYPLAVAAYNARPGNVNKWIGHGDPPARRAALDRADPDFRNAIMRSGCWRTRSSMTR